MATEATWAKIKAEFCAGAKLDELAKRHGVSIADILKHAHAGHWQRRGATIAALPAPAAAEPPPVGPEDEAAQEIIRQHRERTRESRDTYDALQQEFQAMVGALVSFLDPLHAQNVKAAPPGEQIELLIDLLKATNIKFGLFERLQNMLVRLIDLERTVWGLKQTDAAPEALGWEDLAAKVSEPSNIRPLPGKVLDFDTAFQQRKA